MARLSELPADAILEDKIADIGLDYPCRHGVRSLDYKNRNMREKAFKKSPKNCKKLVRFKEHNNVNFGFECINVLPYLFIISAGKSTIK